MDSTARWLPFLAAMMAVAAFVSVVIHNRVIRRNRAGSIEVSSVQEEDTASVDNLGVGATNWVPIPSTPSPTPLFLRPIPTDNPGKALSPTDVLPDHHPTPSPTKFITDDSTMNFQPTDLPLPMPTNQPFTSAPVHLLTGPSSPTNLPINTSSPTNLPTAPKYTSLPTNWPTDDLSILSHAIPAPGNDPFKPDPFKPADPSAFPLNRPASTLPLFQQTYVPGDLTVIENGLLLSTGLQSRQLAQGGEPVIYKNGTESSRAFHIRADGAATFEGPGEGQWVYVSNAESTDHGGAGAITFDADGGMVKYEMILEGTIRNCQGGKTPWNSWVSCEENEEDGQCWETDPFGNRPAQVTKLGGEGGNYESVACDHRDGANLRFFLTDDNSDGEIRRFTPDPAIVERYLQPDGDPWDILSNDGTMEYLVLHPFDDPIDGASGNFSWTSDLETGMRAAKENFRSCEGMDIMGGTLYFVSSSFRELFALDLDAGTYWKSSTFSDDFKGKPDAIALIDGMVYLAEEPKDNKKAGVFGRDAAGNYYTILESHNLRGDATGIAFSPSKKHLYVAFQKDGQLFEITRTDGGEFGHVNTLDVSYHDKSGGYDSKE